MKKLDPETKAAIDKLVIAEIDRRIAELRRLRAYWRAQLKAGKR